MTELKTERVWLRVTESEKKQIEEAARSLGVGVSRFIRDATLSEAKMVTLPDNSDEINRKLSEHLLGTQELIRRYFEERKDVYFKDERKSG